jgi:hypothetical protein
MPDTVANSIERLRQENRRLTSMQQACEKVLPAHLLGTGIEELAGAMMSTTNTGDRD